jgi:SAM-dependent methyltransferase
MKLTHPKQFYKNYIADDKLDEIDKAISEIIVNHFAPTSVFEFGCGSGKNLMLIKNAIPVIETCGQDISPMNCLNAHLRGVDSVIIGDERHMPMRKFDVCFTVSVLDHIPPENIEQVIGNLQAMANKAVVIVEANLQDPENFYWDHNYFQWGFKNSVSSVEPLGKVQALFPDFTSSEDGNQYFIWVWKNPQYEAECAE